MSELKRTPLFDVHVAAGAVGQSQYCIISDENGHAIDDAYVYRFEEDSYLVVINASNTDKDLAHFNNVIKDYDCTITDITKSHCIIAVQGPKDHEWIKYEGNVAVVGISDYAQDALGDLVFVNLPEVGDTVTAGEAFGDVESVKAVSDLNSPVSGTVCAINEELVDSPELLNSDCYGAWIIKVENVTDEEEMLDNVAYEAFCAEEG